MLPTIGKTELWIMPKSICVRGFDGSIDEDSPPGLEGRGRVNQGLAEGRIEEVEGWLVGVWDGNAASQKQDEEDTGDPDR